MSGVDQSFLCLPKVNGDLRKINVKIHTHVYLNHAVKSSQLIRTTTVRPLICDDAVVTLHFARYSMA